ncbi:hypothetical protein LSH36_4g11051 [Paralvinella palmiformis]|uniref:Protein AAR2 homolog n=1 Tax=Paralvinella palmiformis TaxID=53620 RepID=A0AAD9KEE8_9ANNE|nr:hypothetical protein LSH36_4g11051 [Paralvinella palmiformis]
MDPQLAKRLFEKGAIFILLDVPVGTEFGIDYNSWEVGPNFKGVKMIPPGIHFVYYSSVSNTHDVAPRTGFFYNFQPSEMIIRKWDKYNEDMLGDSVSAEEQERMESSKKELDRYLGAYPYESYKKWISLTSNLRPQFLDKLLPLNRKICSVTEFISEKSTSQSRSEAKKSRGDVKTDDTPDEQRLPNMAITPGTEIRFTLIPKQTYPVGASPEEVTRYSMDHSFVLESLLKTGYEVEMTDILGELQFAFICFLIGQVYDAFEQWKKLVRLLCMCDEAMAKHPELYAQFISTIHYQIQEIPEDFFVDIVSQNNFLVSVLHTFFENLESSTTLPTLKEKGQKFRTHLQKRFNWDFTADPDEDCPVVVE